MTASRRPNSPTHYQLLPTPKQKISDINYNLSSPPLSPRNRNQWRRYISYTCFAIGVMLLMYMVRRDSSSSDTISTIIDDEWLPLKASAINVNNYATATISTESETILDFAIVGFEKTGTTFLLKALSSHPEVVMPIKHSELSKQLCVKKDSGKVVLLDWLNEQHDKDVILRDSRELANKQRQHSILKHGMKCSDLLRKSLAIENLADLSDKTKLIVGVRHPVLWFQSLYNYRVRQSYEQNWTSSSIPSPHDLQHGSTQWRGVSTTAAKFDIQLKQLAKVSMTKNEVLDMLSNELDSYELRLSPNPLKVFIYTIEQLEDTNTQRRLQFEKDIQSFLNLQHPLKHFASETKENVNNSSYPESINICDSEYKRIRKKLIRQGTKSSEWIREKFIKSKDVTVSDVSYFESMLKTWSEDPCDTDGRIDS